MSGSRPKPVEEGHLAEQHLGDRLSALVDGELGHETRERVLAHLATCARCKAEADAQRALKSVFAEAAPPPPSASLLARLQGLPGGDLDGDGTTPGGGLFGRGIAPGPTGTSAALGVFGARRGERFTFGYVPDAPHSPAAPGSAAEQRGFRIHPVGRPDDARPASRGLRFAFAAAGAVSLAAIALGGVTTAVPGDFSADARGGSGTGVVPSRPAGSGAGAATPDTQRRRPVGPLLAQGGSALLAETSVAPTSIAAPMVPGIPSPGTGQQDTGPQGAVRPLTAPATAGAAVASPLIRPLDETVLPPLPAWSPTPDATGPGLLSGHGLLSAPAPHPTSAPSASPSLLDPPHQAR
ncbi:zf-HC2 domain-containing protein [Streptomyces sp. NPDC001606]